MSVKFPINEIEDFKLESLKISSTSIGFSNFSLPSEKCIAIRNEKRDKKLEVVVFSLADKETPAIRKTITADSAIINPEKFTIGLRLGSRLQVYDLVSKTALCSCTLDEDVIFWKWISTSVIGIVGETEVYHWNIENPSSSPQVFFKRHKDTLNYRSVDYGANLELGWAYCTGLRVNQGHVYGRIQLYSKSINLSQIIDAHAMTFTEIRVNPLKPRFDLIVVASRGSKCGKINIAELGTQNTGNKFEKCGSTIPFSPEKPDDFPIGVFSLKQVSLVAVVTKYGLLCTYHIETCIPIFSVNFSQTSLFVSAPLSTYDGIVAVGNSGILYNVSIDRMRLVPYIISTTKRADIAISVSSKSNLPGAEDLVIQQFEHLINNKDFEVAAKLAATSPGNILRTGETLNILKSAKPQSNQVSPLFVYFSIILENFSLDVNESSELATLAINKKKYELIELWLKAKKFTPSEGLGDLIRGFSPEMALDIYKKENIDYKAMSCICEMQNGDMLDSYIKERDIKNLDWKIIMEEAIKVSRTSATKVATFILNPQNLSPENAEMIVNSMINADMINECTNVVLEMIKDDSPKYSCVQTKIIIENIESDPKFASSILLNNKYSNYDKEAVASKCEEKGLYNLALVNYNNINDIKRCVSKSENISDSATLSYILSLPKDQVFECLKEILGTDGKNNSEIVSKILLKLECDEHEAIDLFESFDCKPGLYLYLKSRAYNTVNPQTVLKYIQTLCDMEKYDELATICKESNVIDLPRVKDFLRSSDISDTTPLMYICDRGNYINDLVIYLYNKNKMDSIEFYLNKINPKNTPKVIDYILELDCDKKFLENLITNLEGNFSLDEMIEVAERNNSRNIILPYLEKQIALGVSSTNVYTTIAKIFVDKNASPEEFLANNNKYDFKEIGNFCRDKEPSLALIAYKKGRLTDDIISLTNENSMFKEQTEYLLDLSDQNVWDRVISSNNPQSKNIINALINDFTIEGTKQESVLCAVKALMSSAPIHSLLAFLEKLIDIEKFRKSKNLRNLLILTVLKSDRSKLMKYLDKVDDFDAQGVAKTAISKGYMEEAYQIYIKAKMYNEAVDILIDDMNDIKRAEDLANLVNTSDIWRKISIWWLNSGNIEKCIACSEGAKDYAIYPELVDFAKKSNRLENILEFLKTARKHVREQKLDSEYAYALGKLGKISDLEDLLSSPNLVDCSEVADCCFNEKLYDIARILYIHIPNWVKYAQTSICLNDFRGAANAARKAKNLDIWLEVTASCINNGDFLLARESGLNLISNTEKLCELIKMYESKGLFKEIISLLESGILPLGNSKMSVFTQLAILYANYDRARLLPYIKKHYNNISVPMVIATCINCCLWREAVFLYVKKGKYDSAVNLMINHSGEIWDHEEFKSIIINTTNHDTCENAIIHYLEEHLGDLDDLLSVIGHNVENKRLIDIFQERNCLPVIRKYLKSKNNSNDFFINTERNSILLECEDFRALRESINTYPNFDQFKLAQKLEGHKNLEIRRISASLYAENRRFEKSIRISKEDKMYADAIDFIAQSNDRGLAISFLEFVSEIENKCWFALMLYKCKKLIDVSVVMELAWKHKITDVVMPFYIQVVHDLNSRINELSSGSNRTSQNTKPGIRNESRKPKRRSRQKRHERGV